MARIRPLWIQLYQKTPHDLGIELAPAPDDDIDAAKERTRNSLKDWFKNHKPNPRYGRLVDDDGAVIAMYRVGPNQEVELVSEEAGSA